MKFYSPLRYPGGKNKLARSFVAICKQNGISNKYVEPYSGGASVALTLLLDGVVERVLINDLDRSIYAFWYSVVNHTDKLCSRIQNTDITVANWKKQKFIQKSKRPTLLDLGFSTLFLNRTSHSGVLNGGVIGGLEQKGRYKVDCRFNKDSIISRIEAVRAEKNRIQICNLDALELIERENRKPDCRHDLFYLDPPYFMKGAQLYMNHYKPPQHFEVAESVRKLDSNWVVSYDNVPEIRCIYEWVPKARTHTYNLNHTVRTPRTGKEIIFCSEGLKMVKSVA